MRDHELLPTNWAATRAMTDGGWKSPLLWIDRSGVAVGVGILLLLVPLLATLGIIDQSLVSQLGRYCALAILAIGLDLVWGYTGVLSLCQAMFFTLGGYACGMYLCMHGPKDAAGIPNAIAYVSSEVGGFALPWFWQLMASPLWAALAIVLVPGVVAAVFGYVAFRSRVKGVYFSIITQALTVGMCTLFTLNVLRLGGTNGLTNFTYALGVDLREPMAKVGLYSVTALMLVIIAIGALWLTKTRFGRLLVAIRDSEPRLRFAGYSPVWFKTAVFALAAMIGGIGGALYTAQTGIINPDNMRAYESLMVVVWVAVGGRMTITGPVIGTLFISLLMSFLTTARSYPFTWLPHWLGEAINAVLLNMPKLWPFVLGGLFVAVVLYLPDGLVGQWRRWMARLKDGAQP